MDDSITLAERIMRVKAKQKQWSDLFHERLMKAVAAAMNDDGIPPVYVVKGMVEAIAGYLSCQTPEARSRLLAAIKHDLDRISEETAASPHFHQGEETLQ